MSAEPTAETPGSPPEPSAPDSPQTGALRSGLRSGRGGPRPGMGRMAKLLVLLFALAFLALGIWMDWVEYESGVWFETPYPTGDGSSTSDPR